ncbi:MAG: PLD nuclease N-terminal domain-containing protein [Clostridiaceae bacterium]|nr:PLD nuclease N-terminal domain-containing protein [Clostridiaceae bacterium]
MEKLIEYLPFLIPILIVQLILMITALIHVLKHPVYRFGNKPLWIIIVIFGELIGPIVYFIFGRGEE